MSIRLAFLTLAALVVARGAHAEEAFGGLWPGDFGGNMDAKEVKPGITPPLANPATPSST